MNKTMLSENVVMLYVLVQSKLRDCFVCSFHELKQKTTREVKCNPCVLNFQIFYYNLVKV